MFMQLPHMLGRNVHTWMFAHECSHMNVHTWMFTHQCSHTNVHTRMFTHECSHMNVHTWMFTHECSAHEWFAHEWFAYEWFAHECSHMNVHTWMFTHGFTVASAETDPDEHASVGDRNCTFHHHTVCLDPRVTQHQDGTRCMIHFAL